MKPGHRSPNMHKLRNSWGEGSGRIPERGVSVSDAGTAAKRKQTALLPQHEELEPNRVRGEGLKREQFVEIF